MNRYLCTVPALAIVLAGCSAPGPPDLRQAALVIGYELRPKNLARSAFAATHPNGKPSDWIEFRFSSLGAAERGYSEEDAERDPQVREQARAVGMPLLPRGVTIVAGGVDSEAGRQLVLRADDARGKVIVEGYESPDAKPALTREFNLPQVVAAPGVADQVESNRQLGM